MCTLFAFAPFQLRWMGQTASFEPDIHNLHPLTGVAVTKARLVGNMKTAYCLYNRSGKRNYQFIGLTNVAQVQIAFNYAVFRRNAFTRKVG